MLRLLTAIFTIKPASMSQDPSISVRSEKPRLDRRISSAFPVSRVQLGPGDVLSILASSIPAFSSILGDSDRLNSTLNNISTQMLGPMLHSRSFPENMGNNALEVLYQMSRVPAAAKTWKKDVADAFNDGRFFRTSVDLVQDKWLSLIRQWAIVEKDRLPDLYSRLASPTSAGIMFGVGATVARLDADRKTQLNLRRIAFLILACEQDTFTANLVGLLERLEDLVTATAISSPSLATRAEVYMVFRSLLLRTSSIHLAAFWPMINAELQESISSVFPDAREETYNAWSVLQACKLLDVLLLLAPDEFQLHEWLFVTDTIDAVYRPNHWEPVALVDEVSRSLGQRHMAPSTPHLSTSSASTEGKRQPWLCLDDTRKVGKDEILGKLLRPFFDQLSIHAFESTYSMGVPDREACMHDLLADLFNEETVAGA